MNTHTATSYGFFTRALWNFISLKRRGVTELARHVARRDLQRCRGLEIGCGTGIYTQWFPRIRGTTIVALDRSSKTLADMHIGPNTRILRVCADAHLLPFRERCFDFFFSIDTLGHLENPIRALDEMARVSRPVSQFFLHSECNDHRRRWPDKALLRKLGDDIPAKLGGHHSLQSSAEIYHVVGTRFCITSFFSPAALLGWLTGYPEKYAIAFHKASWHFLALITTLFAVIKKTPVLGLLLRLFNASTNHLELLCGIVGGSSCFAHGCTPDDQSATPTVTQSAKHINNDTDDEIAS